MSTNILPTHADSAGSNEGVRSRSRGREWNADIVLSALASLKLTVALFAMGILIILVGTLAQVGHDMWTVIDLYFRCWFAWIDFQVFFPRSWFPKWQEIPFGFWFPGGATIGLMMVVNLISAHAVRFKIQATGTRLTAGLVAIAAGALLTTLVIVSGHNKEGLQAQPLISPRMLWLLSKWGVAALWMASLYGLVVMLPQWKRRLVEYVMLGVAFVALGSLTGWLLFFANSFYLGDTNMRILWQLYLGLFAAVVLLAGMVMVFKKRGGIVLIHTGVGLMMLGQFIVAKYDVEEQMTMEEGERKNYGQDIRTVELAVVDRSDREKDWVIAVPRPALLQSFKAAQNTPALRDGKSPPAKEAGFLPTALFAAFSASPSNAAIRDENLPFDVQVLEYYKNHSLRDPKPGEKNLATAGEGLKTIAFERRGASGADGKSGVDLAAAYVRLTKKDSGEDLGTYLLTQIASAQDFAEPVQVDGKTYDLFLRFQRNYKDYSLSLIDVRNDPYPGTNIPRNYSSELTLVDKTNGEDRIVKIRMNEPLRYRGETFYQSGYTKLPSGKEVTTLAVVKNAGWMIPYVACMLVATGLLAHFWETLVRFLRRRSSGDMMFRWGLGLTPLTPLVGVSMLAMSAGAKLQDAERERRKDQKRSSDKPPEHEPVIAPSRLDVWGLAFTAVVVVLLGGYYAGKLRSPKTAADELAIYEAGKLPVQFEGRIQPLDTMARNALRAISNKDSFLDDSATNFLDAVEKLGRVDAAVLEGLRKQVAEKPTMTAAEVAKLLVDKKHLTESKAKKLAAGNRQPAIRWLLDSISNSPDAGKHKVFRIDHPEILTTLKLERRKDHLYSADEIRENLSEFEKQVDEAKELHKKDDERLSIYQRKLLLLDGRIRTFTRIAFAFRPPHLPPLPTEEDFVKDRQRAIEKLQAFQFEFQRFSASLEDVHPPASVPMRSEKEEGKSDETDKVTWEPYAKAWVIGYINVRLLGRDPDKALGLLNSILHDYEKRDVAAFNRDVKKYQEYLVKHAPPQLVPTPGIATSVVAGNFGNFYQFEAYFNQVKPFYYACAFYVMAFVLAVLAWLGWSGPLNRTAFFVILIALLIHSAALLARIYISGRPPVTNLYSSAVFIGWAAVVMCCILELLYRNGIGNVVAGTVGFATLIIAHYLSIDGDTFTVLQAVLDTQFWLATHVVCITLGYGTTFLAGALAVLYVLRGFATPSLTASDGKELSRMIYGTVCFAMFFSFVGTVLGGLWADDSWGRFWGWDPKENGALIIVLWNALILHARWGGMVKERGLAVLGVAGNIVTAWSWFGVNELGVGLHSYGFTEGRLMYLGLFVLSQFAVIGLGLLPKSMWWSFRVRDERTPPTAELVA